MQSSHRIATEIAIAISSFVLPSSAPWASALWARAENAFITSGAPPRRFLSSALSPRAKSGQSFVSMSGLLGADGQLWAFALPFGDHAPAGRRRPTEGV